MINTPCEQSNLYFYRPRITCLSMKRVNNSLFFLLPHHAILNINQIFLVGTSGFEPLTPATSKQCSAAELRACLSFIFFFILPETLYYRIDLYAPNASL